LLTARRIPLKHNDPQTHASLPNLAFLLLVNLCLRLWDHSRFSIGEETASAVLSGLHLIRLGKTLVWEPNLAEPVMKLFFDRALWHRFVVLRTQ
jgi:hypothetical protein